MLYTNTLLRNVYTLLMQGKYMDTILTLLDVATQHKDAEIIDQLDALRVSYHQLLHYAVRGIADTSREQHLADIHLQLHELLWTLNDKYPEDTDHFVHQMRKKHPYLQPIHTTINLLQCALQKSNVDALLAETIDTDSAGSVFEPYARRSELFSAIICKPLLTAEEINLLSSLFHFDNDQATDEALLIVTALMFSTLNHPQREKIELLFDLLKHNNPLIKVRVLTALYLLHQHIPEAISFYGFTGQLPSSPFLDAVAHAIHQAHYTSHLSETLQKEIFNQLQDISPKMEERLRNSQHTMDQEEQMDEMQELFDETGLSKRLQKMTDQLRNGEDVYYATFRHLKTFPFFNSTINWLIPFRTDNPHMLKEIPETLKPVIKLLSSNHLMCDSDRYSLFFSIKQMPQEQMNMVLHQLDDETTQLNEDMQDIEITDPHVLFQMKATNYIQSLYRFVHSTQYFLSSKSSKDASVTNFFTINDYRHISSDMLQTMANNSYTNGDIKEALHIYQYVRDTTDEPSALLYKKLGYCHERLNEIDTAIECYKEADHLQADNLWTIRHLTTCSLASATPQFEDAILYADKGLQISPNDKTLIRCKAQALEQLLRYEESLATWFRLNYIDENDTLALHSIAVLSAYLGKNEQSLSYFDKLITHDANAVSLKAVFCYAYQLTTKEEALDIFKTLQRPLNHLEGVKELEFTKRINFPDQEIIDYINSLS